MCYVCYVKMVWMLPGQSDDYCRLIYVLINKLLPCFRVTRCRELRMFVSWYVVYMLPVLWRSAAPGSELDMFCRTMDTYRDCWYIIFCCVCVGEGVSVGPAPRGPVSDCPVCLMLYYVVYTLPVL